MNKSNKSNSISKDIIIEHSGDLVHMDQAESFTPGRSLTFIGRNNNKKCFVVSLIVDSISK